MFSRQLKTMMYLLRKYCIFLSNIEENNVWCTYLEKELESARYKTLVKSNQELFINESIPKVKQKTYSAVGQSSSFSKDQSNATDATVRTLEINLNNLESVVEKPTHCSTVLSTHSEHIANPVCGSVAFYQTENANTEYVTDVVNWQRKLEESLVSEVAEDDYATGTSNECSEENSGSGEFEPQHSEVDSKDGNVLSIEKKLCNNCCKLYYKTSKDPSASIKERNIVDPNHWSCNYWMMSNPVRRRKAFGLVKRDFLTLLKYLRAHAQLPVTCSTTSLRNCYRPLVFLNRNLQACKKTRLQMSNAKPKGGGKSRELNSRDQLKLTTEKKLNQSGGHGCERKKPLYVFKVDTNPLVTNKSKARQRENDESAAELSERKRIPRVHGTEETKRSTRSKAGCVSDIVVKSRPKKNKDVPIVQETKQSRLCENLLGESSHDTESFVIEEHSNDSMFSIIENFDDEESKIEEDGDSSPFGRVAGESFREMLAKLSSRHSGSVFHEYSKT